MTVTKIAVHNLTRKDGYNGFFKMGVYTLEHDHLRWRQKPDADARGF